MSEEQANMDYKQICNDFMHHRCKRRDNCKYIHDKSICEHWWVHKSCKYGDECKKKHIENPRVKFQATPIILSATSSHKERKERVTKEPPVRGRNTVCWTPREKPCDMRVIVDTGNEKSTATYTSRDIVMAPNVFHEFAQGELYRRLLWEIEACEIPREDLLKHWHGNQTISGTHYIVNDSVDWKGYVPTFKLVVDRIQSFFNMKVSATRLNIYNNAKEWKPFHHDAAAVDAKKAVKQNFTVGVSFGATREAAFEHAATKCTVSFPQIDGCIYCFAKDTNIEWRHGILPGKEGEQGRISIILWGWVDNMN